MTDNQGSGKFPLVLTAVCTLVALVFGVIGWQGYGSSTIVGLAIVIGAVSVFSISPAAGIAAVVMALPTMHHLVPMPKGSFTLLELSILTAVMGTGVNLLLLSIRGGWKHLFAVFTPAQVTIPVIMLVGACAISFLNLADPGHKTESLREIRTVILEPIIFLVAARMVLRRREYRSWVGFVLMATGSAVAGFGLWQVLVDSGGVQAGNLSRATALYNHPNNLAIFLERSLLLTIGVGVIRPRWIPVWIFAAIQLGGLLVTFSRGALLGVMVGVAVILVFIGAWRWIAALFAAGVLAGGMGLLLFPDRLLDVGGDGAEPTRFAIWRSAIHMIQDHPIFGVGPDQFLYQYSRRYVEPMGWPERYTSHPHNIILDTWLRLGVVGLAAFLTICAGVIWLIEAREHEIRSDALAVGAIAALFGGFAHSMVDNGFFLPDLASLSWLLIVFLITVQGERQSVPAPAPESPPPYAHTWQTNPSV